MRVQTALLEIERQRVKLLILLANAQELREYAVAARAEIDAVKGESVKAIARALSPPGVCSRIH